MRLHNSPCSASTRTTALVRQHCKLGGLAAIYENGFVTISKGEWKLRIEKAVNIPITYGGKAVFNIQNVLPAALAAYVQGVKIKSCAKRS